MNKAPAERIDKLQVLRAIAACAVVLHHIIAEIEKHSFGFTTSTSSGLFVMGAWGVDLFFVISGFVISHSISRTPISAFDFLVKRAIRIAPTYWIYTLLALLALLTGAAGRDSSFHIEYLIKSLLFIPFDRLSNGTYQPILGVGWTLNYEFFFYCIFAILLIFSSRHRLTTQAIAVIVFIAATGHLFKIIGQTDIFYFRSIILEFAYGVFISKLFNSDIRISPKLARAGIVLTTSVLLASTIIVDSPYGQIRAFIWGIPAALIVFFSICSKKINFTNNNCGRLISFVGDSSYSIYLVHIFVIKAAALVFSAHLSQLIGISIFLLGTLLASIILGAISYMYIERPLVMRLTTTFARYRNNKA